jgi:hypothetical protein
VATIDAPPPEYNSLDREQVLKVSLAPDEVSGKASGAGGL